ncbi:MAG: hypothetical protein K6E16_03465 [Lachnospiraceae bacterium]|nr:hypothetical protein [Lachnospiraceae bacterium]
MGGLALFLFGMSTMGSALEQLIDKAFRRIGILCKRIAGYEGQILNYLMLIGKNRIEGDKSETIQNTQGICSVFARIGSLYKDKYEMLLKS